jgi:Uma2 family endonuclease
MTGGVGTLPALRMTGGVGTLPALRMTVGGRRHLPALRVTRQVWRRAILSAGRVPSARRIWCGPNLSAALRVTTGPVTELGSRLHVFIEERRLGYVFDSSTGFRLPGGNVRLPDVAFVARGRFAGEQIPDGFSDVPPDLALEVLSPDDRSRDVLDKVGEYLQAGVRLIWVIDPKRRAAAVYRSLTDVRHLGPDDLLEGEDVLPGFQCRLADVVD